MTYSMTGFGRGEASGQGYTISIEMKSVNNRFLEVNVKMPRILNILEDRMRKMVQEKIQRGRVDIFINIKETEEKKRLVKVDKELALSYDNSLKELAELLNINYHSDIYRIASLPEVLTVEDDEIKAEDVWPYLQEALEAALHGLVAMRENEGLRLTNDITGRIDILRGITREIKERSVQIVPEYQERLRERLSLLLNDQALDETRLTMEVAILADRAAIEEEIVRLESHFSQFDHIVASGEAIGRKLDFLLQEMNREINTIGSKANDLEITRAVVAGKSELEKIREQIQNIE